MSLLERIDASRERWNVLEHPFYRRWECGELSRDELARYAGQYGYAVTALAKTARTATPLAGPEHAVEEAAHVSLWNAFTAAAGGSFSAEPTPETTQCAESWSADDPLEALAVLYAVEAGQPEISRTKLDGLLAHYGYSLGSAATAYFELHTERDREHAAHSRALLERHASESDADRLVAAGEAALRGNWALLDGV